MRTLHHRATRAIGSDGNVTAVADRGRNCWVILGEGLWFFYNQNQRQKVLVTGCKTHGPDCSLLCACLQVVAASGDGCTCVAGAQLIDTTVRDNRGAVTIACVPCPDGTTLSFDGLSCVSCDGCSCPSGSLLQTRDAPGLRSNTTCVSCEIGFGSGADPDFCEPCGLSDMPTGCSACPAGMTKRGLACLPSSAVTLPASAFEVSFPLLGKLGIVSNTFVNLLPAAQYYCSLDTSNRTACQVLANLCTLLLFKDETAQEGACRYYNALVENAPSEGLHGFPSWNARVPWLYYTAEDRPQFAEDVNLVGTRDHTTEVSGISVARLQFMAVVHDLQGNFHGLVNLTSQLQLCFPLAPDVADAWTWFGTNFEHTCSLQIENLRLEGGNLLSDLPMFLDPYLVDYTGDTGSTTALYPLPVSIDTPTGPFYRRFFLYDNITGNGEAVRIATSVTVHVNLIAGKQGKIYPPSIVVTYAELDGTTRHPDVAIRFATRYKSDLDDFNSQLTATICVFAALAVVVAYVGVRAHRERTVVCIMRARKYKLYGCLHHACRKIQALSVSVLCMSGNASLWLSATCIPGSTKVMCTINAGMHVVSLAKKCAEIHALR